MAKKSPHKPLVWLPACHRNLDLSDPGGYTVLADRYAAAVTALGLQPVLFPMAEADDVPCLLPLVDGVLLTGSPSNVEASHFGAVALTTDLLEPRRDKLTMRLVREALMAGVPLLGVCRGLQEMNVALGGSLYQAVHGEAGMLDHREPESEDLAVQFAERHQVLLEPGSAFAQWAGGTRAQVNSLHGQGIKRLGDGLVAEASLFAWGFQFHLEWGWRWHPAYGRIMNAYVRVCWERFARRTGRMAVLQPVVA